MRLTKREKQKIARIQSKALYTPNCLTDQEKQIFQMVIAGALDSSEMDKVFQEIAEKTKPAAEPVNAKPPRVKQPTSWLGKIKTYPAPLRFLALILIGLVGLTIVILVLLILLLLCIWLIQCSIKSFMRRNYRNVKLRYHLVRYRSMHR